MSACTCVADGNATRCSHHTQADFNSAAFEEIEVTMTFTASVRRGRGLGAHDLADAVRFHVNLSTLNDAEAQIHLIDVIDARETHPTFVALNTPEAVKEWLDS